jgi:general secretion pathway protein J
MDTLRTMNPSTPRHSNCNIQRYSKGGHSGFTLLELLIAITIFAIIVSFVYAGLDVVLDTKQQTDEHLDHLAKLQLGLNLIERDIEQTVDRPIRDEFGDSQRALQSGGFTGLLFELTRGGYANPMKFARSELQRVGYQLEDETLYRITWPTLDRAQDSTPHRQKLFDGVKGIELNYFDQAMERHTQWPPQESGGQNQTSSDLPKAIEMILELDKWGKLRRLFRVSEAIPRQSG